MTQEEKELLSQELCARLPYGVKLHNVTTKNDIELYAVDLNSLTASFWTFKGNSLRIGNISTIFRNGGSIRLKPYLRPMSSMTEEERDELKEICAGYLDEWENAETVVDRWKLDAKTSYLRSAFYNSHHLDWNGLIEKGLALEAPEGMYKN